MKDNNIHEGHRQRLYSRFFKTKAKNMLDYEVLEVLLCFKIPRVNVNPTAHRLINKFGSFNKVLEANVSDLMKVEGVGKNTALFLSGLPIFFDKYLESKSNILEKIDNLEKTVSFIRNRLLNQNNEVFMVIALNMNYEVTNTEILHIGDHSHVEINVKEVMGFVFKNSAKSIILAHNHLTDSCEPSLKDLITTETIYRSLLTIKSTLSDHIIINKNNYYSFFANGIIDKLRDRYNDAKNIGTFIYS